MASTHQALRVQWRLARPVVARQHELHLDALLDWSAVQANDGDWRIERELPLATREYQGQRVFQASALVFSPSIRNGMGHMVKRVDPYVFADAHQKGRIALRTATIDTGSGPLKSYSGRIPLQLCEYAYAWCVGDLDGVVELLGRVKALGKLARNSFGLVQDFDVVEADDAEADWWMYRNMPEAFDQSADRSVAMSLGIDYARTLGRIEAPYWLPEKSVILEPMTAPCV